MARRARQARREKRFTQDADVELRSNEGSGGGDPGAGDAGDGGDPVCPICLRPIPPDVRQSRHHLVPKLKGGRNGPTVLVHQICHNEIHSALTESELARTFNTPETLRAHPAIARFAAWVAGKEPGFHSRTVGNHRKRR